MLSENIKTIRKSKGLSQEEFAIKLNVVRQTVSKWERGLSVPDSDMLLTISDVLETPVSTLLGATVAEASPEDLKAISEKLEVINLQLAKRKNRARQIVHLLFIILSISILLVFLIILQMGSPYLSWDFSDPETAVVGTIWHAFEFFFVRIAPIVLIASIIGAVMTRKNIQ